METCSRRNRADTRRFGRAAQKDLALNLQRLKHELSRQVPKPQAEHILMGTLAKTVETTNNSRLTHTVGVEHSGNKRGLMQHRAFLPNFEDK